MDNIIKFAEDKTKELLNQLSVKYSEIIVNLSEVDNILSISIQGDDLGILIGFHGKNLDSLKTVLSLMINKDRERDNSLRILVNVNDYHEKREEQLKAMVLSAKTILDTKDKDSYSFPPMNSVDRRSIHTIAADLGLKTQSDGEGRDRHVNLVK